LEGKMIRLSAVLCVFLTACSTVGDPKSDYYHPFRAGYIALEVVPGVYRVEAKSAPSFVGSEASARTLWTMQAREVCEGNYQEVAVAENGIRIESESTDRAIAAALVGPILAQPGAQALSVFPRQQAAVRTGYAICTRAGLTAEEALSLIKEKGWPLK
jgi:hypothetical protein